MLSRAPALSITAKLGGGPENRTLVVTIRARERRSPLLPPIKKHTVGYAPLRVEMLPESNRIQYVC